MKIEAGGFYRYLDTSTIWLVLHIWEGDAPNAAVIVLGKGPESRTWPVSQLDRWFSCEVTPTWRKKKNVEREEPNPRQTDMGSRADDLNFMAGMLGNGET